MQRADVVIVGAGSAGCVLAGRLSEDPARTVLLLEAGPDPATVPESIAGTDFHRALAEPDRTWGDLMARPAAGQPVRPYRRGRGMGGSSAVNALIGLMGPPDDYDRWERLHGCTGWGWSSLAAAARRVAVPVHPAPAGEWGPVSRALLDAGQEAGWPVVADIDRPSGGVGPAPLTRSPDGRRVSAADAYVTPARGRRNLVIRGDATVERLLVDGTRCTGVELAGGEVIEAGEVILAAGAIHSPALLLRSGVDRPGVGAGLQDHAAAPLALDLSIPHDPSGLAIAALARFSSGVGAPELDLQLLPIDHVGPDAPGLGILSVALMRVRSRGRVTLAPDGQVTAPTVDLAMLSDEADVERLVAGVRTARRIVAGPAMRGIAHAAYIDDRGTPLEALGDTDDEIATWLLGRVGDYVHAACTCRMGPAGDEMAVVDTSLRVVGITGLRVCDASVFPEVPSVNTHLPVMVLAERLAQILAS